ncbi:hypothetical protein J8273_5418 [Carpediemonas membranifera]|uniref:Uncharacterized protein n=1 Tax=Carpediemonas membranifera TaxID=201153 RepID=A0A8J6ARV1_9EUKA|nr:hypothetical protein J8273_5418 [Carpediemonas membranifera]|eukprot:KAG9392428.1 hypothetical protein J8273_5418 [Carpediemonas membranifera]
MQFSPQEDARKYYTTYMLSIPDEAQQATKCRLCFNNNRICLVSAPFEENDLPENLDELTITKLVSVSDDISGKRKRGAVHVKPGDVLLEASVGDRTFTLRSPIRAAVIEVAAPLTAKFTGTAVHPDLLRQTLLSDLHVILFPQLQQGKQVGRAMAAMFGKMGPISELVDDYTLGQVIHKGIVVEGSYGTPG